MKDLSYDEFSLRFHNKGGSQRRLCDCQFELTFGCDLHCSHCYSDCYNNSACLENELTTKDVKRILAQIHKTGSVWLSLTGGDPFTRDDFEEIYRYAYRKGFIITIFTNGYSMRRDLARLFKRMRPFSIEITLNAAGTDTCEKITGVKGSFQRILQGIDMIRTFALPLKIKTQITKENVKEFHLIEKLLASWGLEFNPCFALNARLDGDHFPCTLRVSLREVVTFLTNMQGRETSCDLFPVPFIRQTTNNLFPCTLLHGMGTYIDPYGYLIPCSFLRQPRVNLFIRNLPEAHKKITSWLRRSTFRSAGGCVTCRNRVLCASCPAKSWLEKGTLTGKSDWFCELAFLLDRLRRESLRDHRSKLLRATTDTRVS